VTGRARRDEGLSNRQRYDQAARAQQRERGRSRTPVPERITAALDLAEMDGPQVDIACGTYERNPAGDVDRWEDPNDPALPTHAQVELLAKLTGQPVAFFYEPWTPPAGTIIVCSRRGPKGKRCQVIDTRPDAKMIPLRPGPTQGELF
jgi:hypothetical protein